MAVLIFAFVFYFRVLQSFFTGSDTLWQIDDSRIRSIHDFFRIVSEPQLGHRLDIGGGIMYRPLTSLLSSADYALWGSNPFGYHLVDLLLHLLAVMLLFVVISHLVKSRFAAGIGASVFLVHPAVASSLSSSIGAGDILMTVLFLASFYAFLRYFDNLKKIMMLASLGFYLLALFAKETTVVLWLLMFVYVWLFQSREPGFKSRIIASIRKIWMFAALAAGFFILRLSVLNGMGGYKHDWPGLAGMVEASLHICREIFLGLLWSPSFLQTLSLGQMRVRILVVFLLLASLTVYFFSLYLIILFIKKLQSTLVACLSLAAIVLASGVQILRAPDLSYWTILQNLMLMRWVVLVAMLAGSSLIIYHFKPARIIHYLKWNKDANVLIFLVFWIMLPLALSVITQTYSAHNEYLIAAPFCGLVAYVFIQLFAIKKEPDKRRLAAVSLASRNYCLLSIALIFSIIFVSAFAEINAQSTYQNSRLFLQKVSSAAAALPKSSQIDIYNFPNAAFFPGFSRNFNDYEIKTWLDITFPNKQLSVVIVSSDGKSTFPKNLTLIPLKEDSHHIGLFSRRK
ncbi:MAG: hypothetical protein ACYDET_08625 [Thermoleophilia bacterium]